MKDKIFDVLFSIGLMLIGFYTKINFSSVTYNVKQIFALTLFGIAIVLIINSINMDNLYKLSIVLIAGLWLPNIVRLLIRSADKSETNVSDKISKNIEKIID